MGDRGTDEGGASVSEGERTLAREASGMHSWRITWSMDINYVRVKGYPKHDVAIIEIFFTYNQSDVQLSMDAC